MKRIFFLAPILLWTFSCFAQDIPAKEVPSVVVNIFEQKFPKATHVDWERKAEMYKVEFEVKRQDHSLWINEAGSVVKHKQDIHQADLPASVKAAISKDYKGYSIDEVEKLESGSETVFKVELKKRSEDIDLFFDQHGKKVDPVKM